ncbi:MAG: rhomboid family intramembrane serine protease [Victivallales bacterium]|nr:rhomboid family intramembrane serine protease [Victivallales bacterium]
MTLSAVRALCGQPTFVNMLWHKAMESPNGCGAPCPICGRPMSLLRLPIGEQELELDICCHCQELWFDPTELETLPKPPPPPPKKELPAKAREILAMHAIENMKTEKGEAQPESDWEKVVGFFGFPVEQGAPIRSFLPWCTWTIAALCVVVFCLEWALGGSKQFSQEFGLIPSDCWRDGGMTFLTSMFLHADIFHLVGNLYFLLLFGDNVEDCLGVPTYLLLILLSGLSAGLLHLAFFPHSMVPCIGASGFISGIIAAYAVFFPSVRILFCWRIGGWRMMPLWRWVSLPAWGAFALWIAYQAVMALISLSLATGVAFGAHIGGALFGLAAGFLFRQQVQNRLEELEK